MQKKETKGKGRVPVFITEKYLKMNKQIKTYIADCLYMYLCWIYRIQGVICTGNCLALEWAETH